MKYFFILTILFLWTLFSSTASGQLIADFKFEDVSDVPTSLLKNSVPGAPDALSIHPNARGIDGGVYMVQDEALPGPENIDLDLPEELFINRDKIYLEWELMVQEEFLWLIFGRGTNNSGISHSATGGFVIRYYTEGGPGEEIKAHLTNYRTPKIQPLENNAISTVGFYYDKEEGLATLFVNGEVRWRSDAHFPPTPGEALVWKYDEDFLTVAAGVDGEGSETPSLYRFHIMEDLCPEIVPPVATGGTICPGETATLSADGGEEGNYRWYENENDSEPVAGAVNSTFTTPDLFAPKTYYVALTEGECESERVPAEVNILPLPNAPTATRAERCGPGTITLTATGGTEGSYHWYSSATASAPIAGENNSSYTIDNLTASADFYVSVVESCESERTKIAAVINRVPETPLSQTISRCGPGEVTINLQTPSSTDASAFQWFRRQEDPSPSHEGNTNILKVTAVKDTTIYVRSYNGKCFSEKVPVTIEIHPLPEINAGEDVTLLKGESIQLLAGGDVTQVKWSPSYGLDLDNILTPSASPAFTTTYVITGANAAGCEVSDTITVNVLNEYPVPNAFSPNNDGLNDRWEIPGIEKYPGCKIMIFNRWGNQVFYSEGYQEPWDGTLKGRDPEPGTYYYTLILREELDPVKGTITIIR